MYRHSTAMCEPLVTLESCNDKKEVDQQKVLGSSPAIIIRRRSQHSLLIRLFQFLQFNILPFLTESPPPYMF
jgi:hypothetical protein